MRKCDNCNLCCKFFHINDQNLVKNNTKLCPHWKDGCQIYEKRGPTCRGYTCLWITEYLPEWMKPDKINILIDRFWLPNYERIYLVGHVEKITPEIEKTIKHICRNGFSILIPEISNGFLKKTIYEATIEIDQKGIVEFAKLSGRLINRMMAHIKS